MFIVYAESPVIQSADSRLVIYEADSLLREGNRELSEYGPVIHGFPCYVVNGQVISRFPYGMAIATVPLLGVARLTDSIVGKDVTGSLRERYPLRFEKFLASVFGALAALCIVLMAREMLARQAPALLLGILFAFGTSLWSTASRGLWQHGPGAALVALALLCLVRGHRRHDWRWLAIAALPFGLAYIIRPTAAIPLGLTAVVLLFTDRKAFVYFAALAAAVVAPSLAYNLSYYDTPIIPLYGSNQVSGILPNVYEHLAALLISPSRGLFIFSPFLLLIGAGIWIRRRTLNRVDIIVIGSMVAHIFLIANLVGWEGGASYGPRYLIEILPLLAYLLIPVVAVVARPFRLYKRPDIVLASTLAITFSFSAFVHGRGALDWAPHLWNMQPEWFMEDRDRFWDWSDPMFLRTGDASLEFFYPPPNLQNPASLCQQ